MHYTNEVFKSRDCIQLTVTGIWYFICPWDMNIYFSIMKYSLQSTLLLFPHRYLLRVSKEEKIWEAT